MFPTTVSECEGLWGEFCKAQSEEGKSGCSNGSASDWLHTHRPKVAICPHKQDYCDTCSKLNAQVHSKRTTLNRIRQSGSASVEDQQDLEAEIKELACQHETHCKEAQLSHEDHIKLTSDARSRWKRSAFFNKTQAGVKRRMKN